MRDIVHNIGVVQAIAPADIAATTQGTSVDLLGFDSVAFIATTGARTASGAFTLSLEESDDNAAFNAVAAEHIQAPVAGNLAANSTAKVGYRGFKRYVRPVLTKGSGTSIFASVIAIKGNAAERPVA
ncbi:hypothetical protein [Agrobacterium tumefaciens]|uniref:Uncharacterized protein n=1 Tax=Agrobacterium tumefaciens TaxID=358 RepID=A0AA44JB26_AGRTU|nr:hypothetical protein [Agrobacterium tumefaciens]NTB86391.1 hypothetical protein [Agrobacterium tumefaciens]NTC17407.1 hypothetical protein [Agrobacterium tumefaciens]NTC30268.1 hypothetical protein [Agrobacterium tumefaciens]